MVEGGTSSLVVGAGGLLGTALVATLRERGEQIAVLGRRDLDLSRPDAIVDMIKQAAPARVFNCAAHTDLEAAEVDPALDNAVNARLPGVIAAACADLGVQMVHFSSTGCYGDWKDKPFAEDDAPRPLSRHHQAKLAGEQAVAASGCAHTIFRLGWLYGGDTDQPKNFVWKRILEASDKSEMVSDDVQRGCPTFVEDVVRQVLFAMDRGVSGICNAVAQGSASRYEYVSAIVAASGLPCVVLPGPGYARKAPVSANETAVNARLQAEGVDIMPPWRDSLEAYVALLLRDNQFT